MTPENLSNVVDALTGDSSVTAADDGSRLVALRHSREWRVGFRLTRQSDRPGQWDMEEMAVRYTGSGTASVHDVRSLPLGGLLTQARSLVSQASTALPVTVAGRLTIVDLDATRLAPFLADGRGRGRRSDADFAKLALVYAQLVAEGNRAPAKALSERHGSGSAATWANRVNEARRRGLLTEVKPGQSGGSLTAKAERLLGFEDEDYVAGKPDRL
jgi:hypothetical protein